MCDKCSEMGRDIQFSVMTSIEEPGKFMLVMENVVTGEGMGTPTDIEGLTAVIQNLTLCLAEAQAEIAKRN